MSSELVFANHVVLAMRQRLVTEGDGRGPGSIPPLPYEQGSGPPHVG